MKTIFTALIILTLAIGGIFWWVMARDSAYDGPLPQEEDDIELGQTYTSNAYGFSFGYPNDYFFVEERVGQDHYQIMIVEDTQEHRAILAGEMEGTETPPSITVDVFESVAVSSPAAWAQEDARSNYEHALAEYVVMPVRIDQDEEVIAYPWDGLYRADSFVFIHESNVVMVSVTRIGEEDRIVSDAATLLDSIRLSTADPDGGEADDAAAEETVQETDVSTDDE